MSKAKLVLSAVALFAMVGGALAFKATRQLNTFYSSRTFTTTTVGGLIVTRTICDVTFPTRLTTTVNSNTPVETNLSTTKALITGQCPTTLWPTA
jgi:hypothetical protein